MRKLTWDEIDRPTPDELATLPRHPIAGVLHNVRSIYNVGSMFRTSDAARIHHVHLSGYTGTPAHPDLQKTALGAQDTVPWTQHEAPETLIDFLCNNGYTVGVLEITDTPTRPSAVAAHHFPLALVVGNEVHGVDDVWMDAADLALELPQYGAKQSLNVSVAYGVAVYQLVDRYRALCGPPDAAARTDAT
ncbi:TrmH family RNA methyltransferase [Salisaeta longa]|uniref:TrmH family RNA methyltransferase n=1 Tax=Salisaeta longa TaxID=503170 RepID=UPI0003B5B993|nr:TrmH family RNA methyltransferase [Salisaeta longa]